MKKVLIVRASAIGDIVFASPFAEAIKKTYPDAYISWLMEKGNEVLMADSPYVDECIVMPVSEWKSLWKNGKKLEAIKKIRAFGAELKARHFDVAIDLQGLLKSGIFAWMSSAPVRIGLGSREGSQWLMNKVISRAGESHRISSEYLYLAEQLKLDHNHFTPSLSLNSQSEKLALEKLAAHGLHPGKYVVFAAFTTRPQKHWFADAWQNMAPMVKEKTGLIPILLGGPADKVAAEEIHSGAQDIINLVGQTRLAEAVAIVAHAGALIGVDTGLTHMGIAFDIPTVALFGSTCPYTNTTRDNAKVIWLGLPCSPCRRKPTCNDRFDCLREITPENVMTTLESALKSES
ncbi:lipopolysaccharide heptosyltransferase II [Oxalobacter vibrioformis]|uniref:lipopolysaccharide heptosyltransferase II n=1 Tax=Oxalobacter vibrioformis TaxID=933080 RepID=A0A9E9LYA7_9BURK|nr:lipopolysaccharide heptosyltransferase II [Oxalobacter vibrioformis]WAW10586.1 lipopolysaccharide heptosyltransferase II [Oxalobacter vibrioformis]